MGPFLFLPAVPVLALLLGSVSHAGNDVSVQEAQKRMEEKSAKRWQDEGPKLQEENQKLKQQVKGLQLQIDKLQLEVAQLKNELEIRREQEAQRLAAAEAARNTPLEKAEPTIENFRLFMDKFCAVMEKDRARTARNNGVVSCKVTSTDLKVSDSLVTPVVGVATVTQSIDYPDNPPERGFEIIYFTITFGIENGRWRTTTGTMRMQTPLYKGQESTLEGGGVLKEYAVSAQKQAAPTTRPK